MTIEQGTYKQLIFKRQASKGTLATTGSAQILRRQTSMFELVKANYDSAAEIVSTQQLASNRHGEHSVAGSISGLLSPGTYTDMISAVLRRDFVAVAAISGASITVAGTGPTYTVTRAAGSFLTDGVKIGQVIQLSVGVFSAANLANNLLVTALTATVATVIVVNASALVAEGPIATSTVTVMGKVTFTPPTAQTNIYYTVEEWFPTVPFSQRNIDCKINTVDLTLPGSGNGTIAINSPGLDQTTNAAQYFVAPTVETSSQTVVGASGVLLVNGVQMATVTSLAIKINGNEALANATVGSVVRPDIFRAKVMITGTFVCYFDSGTVPNLFVNETVISILAVQTDSTANNANCIAISIPTLKLNTSKPDDGDGKGLTRSYDFKATYNSAGGGGIATQQTTLAIQDSLA